MPRYCYTCAPSFNGGQSADTSSLTGSHYQLNKFAKHITPGRVEAINSVFAQSDYAQYANYIVSSSLSGYLEIDDRGRHNYVYLAGETTGMTYINGVPSVPCDAVKVVLPYDLTSIHAFPTASGASPTWACDNCGCHIGP